MCVWREHGFNELKFVNRELRNNHYKNIKWQQCGWWAVIKT